MTRSFLLLFISFLPLLQSWGQTTDGSITGRVFDAVTREPLPGANVLVLGTTLGAATDIDGNFTVRSVPPGTYRVQASVIGYSSFIATDVSVASGRQNRLSFPLQPTELALDAFIVQQDNYFTKSSDVQVSAQSLSFEEIRRSPGGLEDVVRAISVLPGVVQASAGRNDLLVRGGAPSENLFVVDNLEIPNINHFGSQGATGGPLSFINLDFVQDVTFSTGGFGARYGDKLSSVMSIQLKEGRSDRFGGKATISASQFGLNAEGPLGSNGSFLFSARRSYLDFIFRAAGFGFVPEYWDLFGKATWKIDPSNEFSLFTIGVLDDIRFFNDSEDKRFSNSRILGNEQNQYVSSFSWKHLVENGFWTFSLGRTFVNYSFQQSDSLLQPIFRSGSREGETSLRADAVYLWDKTTEVSFGLLGKLARITGDLRLDTTSVFRTQTPFASEWDSVGFKSAAYVQISRPLVTHLRATLGARVDYFNLIEKPFAFSPRLALSWAFSPVTTATASGGIYHQAPSFIWLTSNSDNKVLNHVRVTQLVLCIEHLLRPDLKIRLEGYVKEYRDYPASRSRSYLVLANTGAGFGGAEEGFASFGFEPLVSAGEGRGRGVELFVQKRLSDSPWYGLLSLSVGETDFTALDGISRPGLFDQRVILNLSGGYQLDRDWEFSTKLRYGTGTPYTELLAPDGRIVAEKYNQGRLPEFFSLDLRVDRRWQFSGWNLITYLDVQNVTNRKNIQSSRWDPRNQRTELNAGSIGILPSVGISAEF